MGVNFTRLIDKYRVPIVVVSRKQTGFANGMPVYEQERRRGIVGAVVPISERALHQPGGQLTARDRQLILTVPLKGKMEEWQVEIQGVRYRVEEKRDDSPWGGPGVYLLRWVNGA